MTYPIPLSLPREVFLALCEHTGEAWFGPKTEKALCDLIHSWINGTAAPGAKASLRGYQWKALFLPEGTVLRVRYRDEVRYAQVEGESVMHEGVAISPSQLANAFGCGSRNAWRAVWLRFPGETSWTPAERCRVGVGR